MRRAQTALEYLFMLAAVLVLVAIAANVILKAMRSVNSAVSNYVNQTRTQLLENL